MNLKDWDAFELVMPDEWDEDRCPNPATCLYDNGSEYIPLCAEHYDLWCGLDGKQGDGTSPIWGSD